MRILAGLLSTIAVMALPGFAFAQDRSALVIVNSDYADGVDLPDARDAGLRMSEALQGLGFVVTRLENPDAAQMIDAMGRLDQDGASLFYYFGHSIAQNGDTFLVPAGAALPDPTDESLEGRVGLAPALATGSEGNRFVVLDVCHETNIVAPFAASDVATNVLIASAASPELGCPEASTDSFADMFLEHVSAPGFDTDQIFPQENDAEDANAPPFWYASTLQSPFVFRRATSDARLTADDYAMLESLSPATRAEMLRLWVSAGIPVDMAIVPTDGVTVATAPTRTVASPVVRQTAAVRVVSPVRPVTTATIVSAVTPRASASVASSQNTRSFTVTAAPVTQAVLRAEPGEGGLPAPSILVGFVTDGNTDSSPEVVDGAVDGLGISFDDLDARRALREQDEDVFVSLVSSGAFDPPNVELARALQIELARMNCYTSGIDGDWGPGSRNSVARYYEQIGEAAPSQDADVSIFRQIVLRDDVTCPVIARAAPAAAAPRAATQQRAATPARQQAAPQAAAPAAAAPAATTQRRTITQSGGTGVFR